MDPLTIRAEAQDDDLVIAGGTVTIEAAADDKPGPRRIEIMAYSGGMLHLPNFEHPVVVDLQGLGGTDKARPILKDHNKGMVVGHTSSINNDGRKLTVSGVASGTGPAAKEVLATNDNGFPWQASIGARPLQREYVPPGRQVSVNGQAFDGPLIVARKARFNEVSFVVLGADDNTSARIAATNAAKGLVMDFEQWLASKQIAADGLSDAVKNVLRAQYDAEVKASAGDAGGDTGGTADTVPAAGRADTIQAGAADDPVRDARARLVAEKRRLAALGTVADKYRGKVDAGKLATIEASAIEGDWNADKLELELIKAERPAARAPSAGGGANGAKLDAQVIEAALSLTAGMPEKTVAESIQASDRERVMNEATRGQMRGYSLHALMDGVIHAAGLHYGGSRRTNDYIRAALQANQMIQADGGFTTLSLSGILSNVANKGLIAAYTAVEVVWNQICAVRSHGDFKTHTRYRLDSTGAFKKVAADGELKNVGLTDSSFTNQLATYGAIITLTRQMMINDDLGAFMDIPAFLGRMAALRIEEAVFTTLLSNPSSFFASGNGNYATGAGSALSITSLTTAEQKFRDQVDSNGKPVLVSPSRLLVGSALKVTADNLFAEKLLIASSLGSTSSRVVEPARNPHAGKYPPITSPYISNTAIKDQDGAAITGQSSTRWYLFADPAVRAAVAVAFLNGQQTPTIESAQTDFNTLGMQWRSYSDFGVGMEDPKAAVMNDGA